MLVRSWNLFHGNGSPPQRHSYLVEMLALATADRPTVLCVQEVPGWALARFPIRDIASRPPLGRELGRWVTSLHHGFLRGAVAGQGLGIWLGPGVSVLGHQVRVLNSSRVRRHEAPSLHLDGRERLRWARERRIAQAARLAVGAVTLTVVNVHCSGFGGDNRIPDLELMASAEFALAVAEPADIIVLAGDFNVRLARSDALARLRAPGWDFSPPGRGIDHILVSRCAASRLEVWPEPRRRAADGTLLSDHAPIELRLESTTDAG